MGTRVIALPSEEPGGLDVARSGHFGRAPTFTIVELDDDDRISEVHIDDNLPHAMGGGHRMISRLFAQHGVTDAIANGMGAPMVAALRGTGVQIWFDDESATAREAVDAFVAGHLRPLAETDVHQHHGPGEDHVA